MKPTSIPILDPNEVLVSQTIPRHDLHLHTDFTDGSPTLSEYIDCAIALDLEHIGFPEHCNLGTVWLSKFVSAIGMERRRVRGQITVHWGIEVKGMDKAGTLAANSEMIDASEYILGAFHSSQTETPFPNLLSEEAIEMEFDVILGMLKARSCHAISHPGGLSTRYHGSFDDSLFDQLAHHASDNGIALELNPGYGADIGKQLDICIKHGTSVVLGSNAHELSELGFIVRTLETLRNSSRDRK